uniref:Putative secreted protein n=1 Tax=Anopheles darlingi TaxID=43151 RepID=A0A2M4D7Z5_ANODA
MFGRLFFVVALILGPRVHVACVRVVYCVPLQLVARHSLSMQLICSPVRCTICAVKTLCSATTETHWPRTPNRKYRRAAAAAARRFAYMPTDSFGGFRSCTTAPLISYSSRSS